MTQLLTYFVFLLPAILIVNASSAPELSCGVTTKCVNYTRAEAPVKVRDGEYVTNTWQWQNYPGVLAWDQCQKQCNATEGCKSFNYEFSSDNPYEPSLWFCNLYFHPISAYSIDCKPDDTSLDTFWDKDCPSLTARTGGVVPKHPNTDQLNGTCNSVRPPKDIPGLIADQLKTGFNINQTECANFCRRVEECKSYWWQANPTAQFNRPFTESAQYYPWNSTSTNEGCSLAPPQCLLFSQPVNSYVDHSTGSFTETSLYDLNCPTPGNSTASKRYHPYKYGPEPQMCKSN